MLLVFADMCTKLGVATGLDEDLLAGGSGLVISSSLTLGEEQDAFRSDS